MRAPAPATVLRRRAPPLGLAAWTSLGLLTLIVLFAVFGGWLTPHEYDASNLLARNRPPLGLGGTLEHPLGTDPLGRDTLARLVVATRISILVALLGTISGACLGTLLGIWAVRQGGLVDDLVMAAVDVQASLPFIVIALAVVAFFGNSLALFLVLMGIFGWEVYARQVRAAILAETAKPYVTAARALGLGDAALYRRHLMPNIAYVLIVQFTLNFPQTILLETGLSFLGLGIQPPLTSLGRMLGEARDGLIDRPWAAVIPGVLIFATALAVSFLGDRLRDRLDPTLSE